MINLCYVINVVKNQGPFEDADLTRELRKVGRAVYNPAILVIHKWHRENKKINKSFWTALKSMFIYMKKWK